MVRMMARLVCVALVSSALGAAATRPASGPGVEFVDTSFENASPVQWETDAEGTLHVYLNYDYERNSPNRAAGHWYFRVEGKAGSDLTVVLHNFDNVWNGRAGSPVSDKTICYVSSDGKAWSVLPTEKLEGNLIRVRVKMEGAGVYLARLEPYRLSDLERLLGEIGRHRLVEVSEIGKTVEGRPLEIIRVGNPAAPHRVFLRARAHAWEPGGNWVVEGLIRGLLRDDEVSRRCLERYCVYVMPMANKDGVARGWTRFNVLGKDLNRNWDKAPDQKLAPENDALERWLKKMVDQGRRPELLIDLHNDEAGRLHISRPNMDLARYLGRMQLLEKLLRKHTWFTEGSTAASFSNPGSIGEGLLERYGIDACVLELNCNWIAGLKEHPTAKAWGKLGEDMRLVFYDYFADGSATGAP